MITLRKKSLIFLAISIGIWSLIPLLRHSLPLDTQEAIIWGKYCLWGTTKHPPLSGWIADGFYRLWQGWDGSMYLLSQLCVGLGLIGIYHLAKQFLSPTKALLATAFQMGIIFYHFSAVEFNVNVLSLTLWPWVTSFFWRAYRDNRLKDWVIFGLLMGLNILNKYVGGVLAVALGAFIILCPQARKTLKNPKAYLGGIVCMLCLLPHFLWLWDNHFEMWKYIAGRNPAGKIKSVFRHLIYPAKFLLAQLLFALPAGLTFALMNRKKQPESMPQHTEQRYFLLCLGIVPTAFWVVSSLISGGPLKDMWNFPSLFAWGTIAFYFFPRVWESQTANRFVKIMFGWSLLFAAAYAGQCLVTPSERFHSDCPAIVDALISDYRQAVPDRPLAYVGGTIWFSDMVALYAPTEVKPMIWMQPAVNPWLNKDDFEKKGALLVAESESEYQSYRQQLGDALSDPVKVDMTYHNYFGKKKHKPFYWGIYQKGQ